MKKLRIGILFGGPSAEHEVSIQSAKNVYEALDKEKYEPVLIGITKKGNWIPLSHDEFFQLASSGYQALPETTEKEVSQDKGFSKLVFKHNKKIDIVFPVLHGPFGEDGTLQGFLRTLKIPFVGAGVLGSAIGMDKDVMKRLLRDAGLPIGKFITLRRHEAEKTTFSKVVEKLGLPLFVKPANLGSSVGVAKVASEEEFKKAVHDAFSFDTKILIEEYIKGREIECSVLGNEEPEASVAGEIVPRHEFYDYQAKYIDEKGAVLKIPAEISEDILRQVQALAIKTFQVLECAGLARVDFFLTPEKTLYVNEINTIPGFTKISMYPALWEKSGVSYTELLDRLLTLALQKYKGERVVRQSLD